MSLSFTEKQTIYGDLTNDSSTNNLTFGKTLINEAEKRVINKRAWDFTQDLFNSVTVADQANYKLPTNYRRAIGNITVTSSGETLIDSWEFQGNADSTSGNNDLTEVNSPTYVDDSPFPDPVADTGNAIFFACNF